MCTNGASSGLGKRERYGGTEYGEADLVDKSKLDIVVFRYLPATLA